MPIGGHFPSRMKKYQFTHTFIIQAAKKAILADSQAYPHVNQQRITMPHPRMSNQPTGGIFAAQSRRDLTVIERSNDRF